MKTRGLFIVVLSLLLSLCLCANKKTGSIPNLGLNKKFARKNPDGSMYYLNPTEIKEYEAKLERKRQTQKFVADRKQLVYEIILAGGVGLVLLVLVVLLNKIGYQPVQGKQEFGSFQEKLVKLQERVVAVKNSSKKNLAVEKQNINFGEDEKKKDIYKKTVEKHVKFVEIEKKEEKKEETGLLGDSMVVFSSLVAGIIIAETIVGRFIR
eukprot:snap_masked-scaffold_6-processed-gene-16.42-mRNA-1 protein AED:1.00 eAED:1.00 QI:0/-1/0/0/-1/1/1/0/208